MVLPSHDVHFKRGSNSMARWIFQLSLCLNVIMAIALMFQAFSGTCPSGVISDTPVGKEMVWNGGHPSEARAGSCWCGGQDHYCMCTPSLAIDLVIVSGEAKEYLWLVRRRDTNQLAVMGGFVDNSETPEQAVYRELKEEMGVDLVESPILFGVYSDPRRDNRRRTSSAVYSVYLHHDITPRAGDDAKEVKKIRMDEIEKHEFFADHRTILMDYRRFARGLPPSSSSEGDFAADIARSTCASTLQLVSKR